MAPAPTSHRADVLPRSPYDMVARCYTVHCSCGWTQGMLTKRGAKMLAAQHMDANTDTAPVIDEDQPMYGPFGRL